VANGADRTQRQADEVKTPARDRPAVPDVIVEAEASDPASALLATGGPELSPTAPPDQSASAPGAMRLQRQATLLRLQQTRGNQYVARLLAQRQGDPTTNPAPAPSPATATPAAPEPSTAPGPGVIVDDGAPSVLPGQMTKSAFLAQVRTAVDSTVEQSLAGSPWAALARPKIDEQIDQQFTVYGNQDGPSLERSIRQHVPTAVAATTAQGMIDSITEQLRQTIVAHLPGSDGATGAVSNAAGILFQAREGGAPAVDDPQAIQSQLTAGQGLDGGVRTGMEAAFGQSFSDVRVHSDATAGQVSESLNARAFTVGHDVAFGVGEYRPGTPVGDALIAHELAHVVQQGGSTASAPLAKGEADYSALEAEADVSAVGAVASLWAGAKGMLGSIAQQALPQLKAGLRLQRCNGNSAPTPAPSQTITPTPTQTPTPTPSPTTPPNPTPNATPAAVAPGTIRRIPLTGLGVGFQGNDLNTVASVSKTVDKVTGVETPVNHLVSEFTSETAAGKAVAYVPDGAKTLTSPRAVDVLVVLHGYNIGYRQPRGGGQTRDQRLDLVSSQLTASGRLMIAILPQGGYKSDFGTLNTDDYVAEVFKLLISRGDLPNGVAPGRVVLSGHSGAGGPLQQMFQNDLKKQAGQTPSGAPTLPATMGEIVLMDEINDSSANPDGAGQCGTARKWVESQLNRDLANVQKAKADATAQGSDPIAAQLNYLKSSLRFRGYYSHTSGDYYARSYKKLDEKITKWFSDHAGDLGGASSSVFDALRKNYTITDTGHSDHDAIIGKTTPALGGKAPLEDALGALTP
jgi:Domain of unknown function (DUF4157)